MKVSISECYNGHDRYTVRVQLPNGNRYTLPVDNSKYPSRGLSTKILNMLESVGVKRKNVKLVYK